MAQAGTKMLLSGSTNGKGIKVVATSTLGTTIHTAVSGTSSLDEIYLYAYNDATSSAQLNILWGGTIEPNNVFRTTILSRYGRTLVADGMLLTSGSTVSAYSNISGSIMIDGFVNRIT